MQAFAPACGRDLTAGAEAHVTEMSCPVIQFVTPHTYCLATYV